jgi:crotonobetainyl-CoA:carnitine CoA-transferase CaiB-like acyl-CoA transferase
LAISALMSSKSNTVNRGDDTREWGIRVGATETTYFNSVNRNKGSACPDLQKPEGQRKLANYRSSAMWSSRA